MSRNPALSPPQPWTLSDIDLYEVGALIRKSTPPTSVMLRLLAEQPGECIASASLASQAGLDDTPQLVADLLQRVNQVCDAFGKDPLIDGRGGLYSVTEHHAQILRASLEQAS